MLAKLFIVLIFTPFAPQKSLEKGKEINELKLNELGRIRIKSQQSLHFDPYEKKQTDWLLYTD